MEDTVRTMLQYKSRCELLNQEKASLAAAYEVSSRKESCRGGGGALWGENPLSNFEGKPEKLKAKRRENPTSPFKF